MITAIYGAGVYGNLLYDYFLAGEKKIDFFVQTEVLQEECHLNGLKVLSVNQFIQIEEPKTVYVAIRDHEIAQEIKISLFTNDKNVCSVYDCSYFIKDNLSHEAIKPVTYEENTYEHGVRESYWKELYEDSSLLYSKRQKLIEGMSENDITQVDRIIEQMTELMNNDIGQDIYSPSEKKAIFQMEQEFVHKTKHDIEKNGNYFNQWQDYLYPSSEYMEASVFYYQCGVVALKNIDRLRSKCIIDAGAYIGDSSIVLAQYTDDCVYAFEGFDNNCRRIQELCKVNSIENVIAVNKALGDCRKEQKFYLTASGVGHGLVKRKGVKYENEVYVSTITLDEFVKRNQLDVGLIKADIESGERFLIDGAKQTIQEQSPALLISIYHNSEDFFSIKDQIASINPKYKFSIFRPLKRNTVITDTMLICEIDD